jgi:predicted small lipoprotein YifL
MSAPARRSVALLGAAVAIAVSLAGCGHKKPKSASADLAASKVTQIGVNAYLWRASLDTVSFMPLAQVDSNGGVIVTDWYANPNTPTERMKLTVAILDQDLRADAIRVAASRQVNQNGMWVDAPVAAQTTQRLEEIILGRARDLRRGAVLG